MAEAAAPGQEVLQGARLVVLLTLRAVPVLKLHLADAGGESVDVVEHGLHGDGNLVGLLPEREMENRSATRCAVSLGLFQEKKESTKVHNLFQDVCFGWGTGEGRCQWERQRLKRVEMV